MTVPRHSATHTSDTERPTLVTNPADDADFHDDAEAALDEVQGVSELQASLRRDYPSTVVRARDLAGERPIMWYVYRDGHWVMRHEQEQA